MFQGHIQKRGWSPIRYACEAAFHFTTMRERSLIKGRNGWGGNKSFGSFSKGWFGSPHNPIFQPVRNQHFKETSHSCSMLDAAYQEDLLSNALMEATDVAPQTQVQSTLRFLTSIRWNCACVTGHLGSIPWLGRSPGEGKSTPVSLPEKCHGQRSLVGCSPWDCKELSITERLMHSHFQSDSLRPHELQHARLPLSMGVFSN